MKRSEMLKLIKSKLDAGRDWADLYTRAENLLASIEETGMLPPRDDKRYYQRFEGEQKIYDYFKNFHEWEPEQ